MAKTPAKPDKPPDFEQALEQLEQIVNDLEEGDLGLSESLKRYERGVRLLRQCHALLEQAEHKIEQLSRVDARGEAVCEPLEDRASLPEEGAETPAGGRNPAEKPRRRRRPPPDEETDVDSPRGLF